MSQRADAIGYLQGRGILSGSAQAQPLGYGAGGARVLLITDGAGQCVLKQSDAAMQREAPDRFASYRREYEFYGAAQGALPIPEVLHREEHPEHGLLLVLRRYERIAYEQWDSHSLYAAMDLIARVHSTDTRALQGLAFEFPSIAVSPQARDAALSAWEAVLDEHPGHPFERSMLDAVAASLDTAAAVLNAGPHGLCHGDCHADNILRDDGRLLLCDWQNVTLGNGAADVAFFISRGKAAGIALDEGDLVRHYCQQLSEHTGKAVEETAVWRVIHASTVVVSFLFWANYLLGADAQRVADVYGEMVAACRALKG